LSDLKNREYDLKHFWYAAKVGGEVITDDGICVGVSFRRESERHLRITGSE